MSHFLKKEYHVAGEDRAWPGRLGGDFEVQKNEINNCKRGRLNWMCGDDWIESNETKSIRNLKWKWEWKWRQQMCILKSDPEDDGTVIGRNIRSHAPNDTASHTNIRWVVPPSTAAVFQTNETNDRQPSDTTLVVRSLLWLVDKSATCSDRPCRHLQAAEKV